MARLFAIAFSEGVKEDLDSFRPYDCRILLDAIGTQLRHTPHVETKRRKLLHDLVPPFEAIPPVWQLRVGAFRVFYDVSEEERRVYIRAIRRKPGHLKTEESL